MDQTLKNIRASDEGVELFDRLEKLDDLCARMEALGKEQETECETCKEAFNIGLSAFSEITLLKNKIKVLEQSIPLSATPQNLATTKEAFVSESQTEQIFNELAKKWKDETVNLSSIQKITSHSAYLQIIGLGPVAIRLILNELTRAPDFWLCALRALTRTNPVPPEMSGDLNAMTKVWLDWGQTHEYP